MPSRRPPSECSAEPPTRLGVVVLPCREDGGPAVESHLRALLRAGRFAAILGTASLEFLALAARGRMRRPIDRARWLQRICQRLVRLLDLRATYRGQPAARGFLVFNHVSYLDVVVLAARDPMVFVAKKEVRSWPVVGGIAAWAGTIFIDRARRADVVRVNVLMRDAVAQGVRVCLFPEGTSSDGTRVLPFRTSLLEPVIGCEWPVTAGWIGYPVGEGGGGFAVPYWGDMNFVAHFWRLLHRKEIRARVGYTVAHARYRERKDVGRELHEVVSRLSLAT